MILNDVLGVFMQKGAAAIGLLTPLATSFFGLIMLLDFTWAAIQNVLSGGSNTFKMIVQKVISYGIYGYIIANYKTIIDQILDSFIKIGLVAAGNAITEAEATNPSNIIDLGYNIMDKMYSFGKLIEASSPDAPAPVGVQLIVNAVILYAQGELTVAKLIPNMFFGLVSILVFLAFAVIAFQLFITWVETYFITSIAIMFLPCAIFKPFAFLAEKAIGAVIGAGVKLMMLLFVVGVSVPILKQWTISTNPTAYDALLLLSMAAAVAFLCWQAPGMAASLMTGAPSLTAGSMLGGAAATAALAGAAVSAVASTTRATAGLISGLSETATMTAANAGVDAAAAPKTDTGTPPTATAADSSTPAADSAKPAAGVGMNADSIASRVSGGGSGGNAGGGLFMPDGSWHSFGGNDGSEASGAAGAGTGSSATSGAAEAGTGSSATDKAAGAGTGGATSGITAEGIAARLKESSSFIPPEDTPTGGMEAKLPQDND